MVSFEQLIEIGLSRRAIARRVQAGRLHRVHRGVYAVGHPRLTLRGVWMAATLACGPGAVLSHVSAAVLWGLLDDNRSRTDVTAGRERHQRRGLVVHRARHLLDEDRATRDGIPVTSVARTLLDVAQTAPRRLERAFEAAERARLLDMRAMESVLARSHGHRGLKRLAPLVAQQRGPAPEIRSHFERRFLRAIERQGLPRPLVNATVEGLEVDLCWPEHRLIVELDSAMYHHTRAAFERDRRRDAKLLVAGYRVVRVTDERFDEDRESVMRELAALTARRSSSASPRTAARRRR